jgi:hypothetical protein
MILGALSNFVLEQSRAASSELDARVDQRGH